MNPFGRGPIASMVSAWAYSRTHQVRQHLWLRPGWKMLPTRAVYCSNTNCAHRFRYKDNNISFMHVQPQYYRVRQVEPCNHKYQALFLSI